MWLCVPEGRESSRPQAVPQEPRDEAARAPEQSVGQCCLMMSLRPRGDTGVGSIRDPQVPGLFLCGDIQTLCCGHILTLMLVDSWPRNILVES